MDDLKINVEGHLELRKALRKADDDLPKELKEIHRKLAEMVVRAALPNVPVLTGKLLGTIKPLASQRAARAKAGTAKSVPYAAAIHWGEGSGNVNYSSGKYTGRPNRNVRGRPFLWEAMQKVRPTIEKDFLEGVEELIDEAMRIVR